ncbi:MAG: type 1 glutamine amidotransferase family protein [Roseiflexaceae bacterium]
MEQQTIYMFVFDTLADWEAGFAMAGLNKPEFQAQPGRFRVATFGISKAPVVTVGGVTILPDLALDELTPERSAMLILPGGGVWDQGGNTEVLDLSKRFLAAGVPVAAICGATSGLARAGILDNLRHTSNARAYLAATGYRGTALYQDQPAVTDGNVITASSTAPIEFAYEIFKKLDVYSDEVLEAWFGLFKTGDAAYYGALTQQANA